MPEFLQGSVDVPAVGRVKKRYVMIPVGIAAAYIGFRWYQARQDAASAPAADNGMYTTDDLSEYGQSTTGGTTAVTGNTGSTTTDATNPNSIDDNAEWTARAVELLGNAGYDTATVYGALGEFLARRSLDASEATIARAAIAAAGQPPVNGPYSVIEAAATGTATPGTVSNVHVTKKSATWVNLAWTPIPGYSQYDVYRSGAGNTASRAGAGSTTVYGLTPNTTYSFQVAAVSSTGKVGPKSASVSVKTDAQALARASTPTVTAVTKSSFRATVKAIPGATRYRWWLSGREQPSTEAPYRDFTGLKANTTYSVGAQADAQGQSPGPMSASKSVKTKK